MLYQHKIPAFKEMQKAILNFNRHIFQNLVEQKGSDLAPESTEENYSTLHYTNSISDVFRLNEIYFNKKSRNAITSLINNMYFLSGLELQRAMKLPEAQDLTGSYTNITKLLDETINILYKDLNLK